jgi:protein phosphatase slingshot
MCLWFVLRFLFPQNGITHIVNLVSDDVDNFYPDSFSYFNVAASCSIDDPIDDHFEKVAKFVFEAKDAEGKVLMHCIDCVELAPAFVTAYMLIASYEKHKKLPLKDAYAHVSKNHKDTSPNDGACSVCACRRWM